MKADSIRLLSSAIIAVVLVAGGLFAIYQMALMKLITGGEALAIYGPLIGLAAAWALGRDATTQGARSFEAGVTKGATSAPSMTVTSAGPPPTTTTVTPAPPQGDTDA